MKSQVKISVHPKSCLGCEREGKPVMLSLDGNNSKGEYVYLDAFLTNEEAKELIGTLIDVMVENERK